MTRQDFQLIADVIHDFDGLSSLQKVNLGYAFADALAETNPRFDADRFLTACFCARTPETNR